MMKMMHRICSKTSALLLLGLLASCDRPAPEPPAAPQAAPAAAPATRSSTDAWTTGRVVEDPAGYRQWWEKQSATRIEEYRQRLAEVQARQAAFERSWEALTQNLLLAQSIASQVTR